MKPLNTFQLLIVPLVVTCCLYAEQKPTLRIYHDSDYSNHKESAQSMKMGFLTALSEVNHTIQGYHFEFIEKDHRGNSIRSKRHMQQFIEDPNALLVLGGLHSPPYIRFRDFINQNEILLLIPWAAGAPITRYPGESNWIFRLSIDDAKAGFRIGQFAVDKLDCQTPHLLLEDTPWGKSNQKNMTLALKRTLKKMPGVSWFNWNTKFNTARIIVRDILNRKADCILFVANSIEGEVFVKAMASMEKNARIPIVSHWGITGGDFHKRVSQDIREKVQLFFIQSCFSFISSAPTELSDSVFKKAAALFPDEIKIRSDIPAPPGFIHSYDLAKILIQALNNIQLTHDIKKSRELLRVSLENIGQPVQGLIKTYNKPYDTWTTKQKDAHEALGIEDFCMAQYNTEGHVILNKKDN